MPDLSFGCRRCEPKFRVYLFVSAPILFKIEPHVIEKLPAPDADAIAASLGMGS
jgi:hypothetical protein